MEALFAEESLEVKPVEVFAEVLGSFEVPFEVPAPYTNRPAWWPRGDKPSYASSMSDTSGLSHDDLEDIVMNLRKQSRDDDQVSKSDESDYDESDDADQVLGVDDHIFPVAEPYWCAEHEFSNVHDDELQDEDELWLSAVSCAIVADRGDMELSPLYKPVSVPALVLPPQFGAAS